MENINLDNTLRDIIASVEPPVYQLLAWPYMVVTPELAERIVTNTVTAESVCNGRVAFDPKNGQFTPVKD